MDKTADLPHLLVIGATGRVGQLVVKEASELGYSLTVLVRDPVKVQDNPAFADNHVKVKKGDPCKTEDLSSTLSEILSEDKSSLVIVSTLGQTRKSGNPWAATTSPAGFMSNAATALIAACQTLDQSKISRIHKYVILSMFGVNDSYDQLNCLLKPVMQHSNMLQTLEDHNMLDNVVHKQEVLTYVLVRAAMLTAGDACPVKDYGSRGDGINFWPSISMASVAAFLVEVCKNDKFDNASPVIAN